MRHRFFTVSDRAARNILVGSYAVITLLAAFWWLPKYFGAKHPIEPMFGIGTLILVWVLMLNEWPQMAPLRLFGSPRPAHAFLVLGVISALSICGFAL